jgi:hypothetical protein
MLPSIDTTLRGQHLSHITELTNLKVTALNGTVKLLYNLTEIQLRRVSVNNNRLKVRFNEQRDTIEVAQDDIDIELQLRYRIVSRPPVMVDAGIIRVTVEDLSFNG